MKHLAAPWGILAGLFVVATTHGSIGTAASRSDSMTQFEETYARYLKDNPVQRRVDEHNARVTEYNQAAEAANQAQAAGQADLDAATHSWDSSPA